MPELVLTDFGRQLLADAIAEAQEKLRQASLEKGAEASGQDSWHDEGYKQASVNEMMWSRRYGELREILTRGKVVVPLEQAEKVLIGNAVRVRYEDGETERHILDGYLIESVPHRLSCLSPLGKALLNATKGSRVVFASGGRTIAVVVEEIFPPSAAAPPEAPPPAGGGP
jgi:transcription elongation GreA/GreB family factor